MTEISTKLAAIDLGNFSEMDMKFVKSLLDHKVSAWSAVNKYSSQLTRSQICQATGLTPDALAAISEGRMPVLLDETDKVWVLYRDEEGDWKIEDRRPYLPNFDDSSLVYLWYVDAVRAVEERSSMVANWRTWK